MPPHSAETPHRVLVMVFDWFYLLDVYPHPTSSNAPRPLDASVIEGRMSNSVRDAAARRRAGERATPIGLLTGGDRDTWANDFRHLASICSKNQELLRAIQSTIFAVSLDDCCFPHVTSTFSLINTKPAQNKLDAHLCNIRSGINGHNRWFDKALTLVVEPNTRAGFMGKHTTLGALLPSMIGEYAVAQPMDPQAFDKPEPLRLDDVVVDELGWNRIGCGWVY